MVKYSFECEPKKEPQEGGREAPAQVKSVETPTVRFPTRQWTIDVCGATCSGEKGGRATHCAFPHLILFDLMVDRFPIWTIECLYSSRHSSVESRVRVSIHSEGPPDR
jgi:hypothetical protein